MWLFVQVLAPTATREGGALHARPRAMGGPTALRFRKTQIKLRTSRDKADVLEKAAMKREQVALQDLLGSSG